MTRISSNTCKVPNLVNVTLIFFSSVRRRMGEPQHARTSSHFSLPPAMGEVEDLSPSPSKQLITNVIAELSTGRQITPEYILRTYPLVQIPDNVRLLLLPTARTTGQKVVASSRFRRAYSPVNLILAVGSCVNILAIFRAFLLSCVTQKIQFAIALYNRDKCIYFVSLRVRCDHDWRTDRNGTVHRSMRSNS